jgi:predicted transcriptional regulator
LPDLELECMKALWRSGDLTVRAVHEQLKAYRPLAYTTVLTVLDRLAQKGVVTRRKSGRAHLYHPLFTLADARKRAVNRVLEHYFDGSRQLLLEHLASAAPPAEPQPEARQAEGTPLDTSLL